MNIILTGLLFLHLANGHDLRVEASQVVAWACACGKEGAPPKARAILWTLAPTVFYVIEEPAEITKQMEGPACSTK